MSKFLNYDNYEIYPDGKIWSYKYKKFLKPATRKDGYQIVGIYDNEGNKKWYQLHRVVYETFTGETIPEGMQVNHINEIKTDNRFENLNLMTPKENINYGTCIERRSATRSKTVGAFKNGELVMTFTSTAEAQRQGFSSGAVSKCCRNCFNRPGNNVYKGYEWRYL